MACREPFSCLPRSAASDTAVGATATVSEAKLTSTGCQALRYTPDTLRVCVWVVRAGEGGGKGERSQAGGCFEWQLDSATFSKSTQHFLSPILLMCEGVLKCLKKTKSLFSVIYSALTLSLCACFPPLFSLFAVRCAGCTETISPAELVMRAGAAVFHLRCFTCSVCSCRLQRGDRCVLREGQLLCAREGYHQCLASPSSSETGTEIACFHAALWFVINSQPILMIKSHFKNSNAVQHWVK